MDTQEFLKKAVMRSGGLLVMVLMLMNFAGCHLGMVSKPVQRTLERPSNSYETAFSAAIRAMNDVGKVTSSDKDAGYVNGASSLGVDITVTLLKLSSGGVKLVVKGKLPGDKWIMGSSTDKEVDNFLKVYKSYSSQ